MRSFTPEQADRLADALGTADRLLRCASVATEIVDPASAHADIAMRRYFDELDRRFADGFDAADDSPDERRRMAAPRGAFLVLVEERDVVVGCDGVYRVDGRTAEIKRMWLDPTLRGLGMGKRLLAELEAAAAALGCRDVVLDTNASLDEAIAMYTGAG